MKLYSIQYLRCVAVTLTIMIHLVEQLHRFGHVSSFEAYLPSGVDLFFVISGFIMWVTTYQRRSSPLGFLWRRFVRIVPLYWLITGFMVAVMLVAPSLLQSGRFDLYHVVASFLFIPAPHPATGLMEPVLVPGWTLNYEFFFYLIFAASLLLPAKPRAAAVVTVLTALVCLQALGIPDPSVAGFYTSSVLLEFAAGVLLGAAYLRGWSLPRWPAFLLLAVGVVALVLLSPLRDELPRSLIWGLPGLAIMVGLLSVEMRGKLRLHPLLAQLGDASYSIYLSHGIMLSAWTQAWRLTGWSTTGVGLVVFGAMAVVLSLLFGVAVYYCVERPLIRFFRPKKYSESPPAAAPGSAAPDSATPTSAT